MKFVRFRLLRSFSKNSDGRFFIAFGSSLVLHLLILSFLSIASSEVRAAIQDSPVFVSLVTLPPPPPKQEEKQIVTPSEAEEKEPEETRLVSERDSRTEREQIKRGDGNSKPSKASPQAPQQPPSPARRQTPTLRLSENALAKAIENIYQEDGSSDSKDLQGKSPNQKMLTEKVLSEKALSDEERERKLFQYQPFARFQPFSSQSGSPDYLPSIPDGDITLLNAKADRFAVFVRRVALQVFGSLRKHYWHQVPGQEIEKIKSFVYIQARLSPQGKLLSTAILDSSGSAAFDSVLRQAVNEGAWDQNPPKEALSPEGDIIFIFKSKAWTRGSFERMPEQRWILLGTGLL